MTLSKRRPLAVALCLGLIAGLILSSTASASAITEFDVPTVNCSPWGITAGPDGNLWFTERDGNHIGRIMPGSPNTITEFDVPTTGSSPRGITAGPDGNLWFTEYSGNKIGKITTDGVFTEYDQDDGLSASCSPDGITAGPDGNIWFTESATAVSKIGRVNLDHSPIDITEFAPYTASSSPYGITSADGKLWFTENAVHKIGRMTIGGVCGVGDEFTVPIAGSGPWGITVGPDENLWFTECTTAGNKIGRVNLDPIDHHVLTPNITEFAPPTASSSPRGITAGPDGNLWFAEYGGNKIGRLQYAEPSSTPTANTWVTDGNVKAIVNANGITYIGGEFTQVGPVGGSMQPRNRIAAIDATTGEATSWNPDANGTVNALAVSGTTVYAGGAFTTIGVTTTRNRIAAIDATGAPIDAWNPNANGAVNALAISGTTVYAGGAFTTIGVTTRNYIAAIDATGAPIDAWNPNAQPSGSYVNALAVSGTTIYAGGAFTTIGGQTRNNIAALNASDGLVTSWDPNANGVVRALAVSGTTIYAGGGFTTIGVTTTRNRIAALNNTTGAATLWNPNASSWVNALAVSGTTVYAGGAFTAIGGQTRNRIAALDASGSAMSWNPDANSNVNALAVSGTTVYAGGAFTTIGGVSRPKFAQFDCPSPTVTGITPNSGVYNESVSITNLAGTEFRGPTVKLTMSGQPDITATSVVVVSRTKITCTFDLNGKAAGLWNVVVTNGDGGSGTLANSFTIIAGGSITVVGTGMDYGSRAAGTTIPYDDAGGHHEVAVTVSTNCTTWAVTCASSPLVLTSGSEFIPSADFKYTSVYGGTGTPVNPTCYSNQTFSASSSIMANPSAVAADACLVNVQYWLDIPATQAAVVYTAIHTYTLTVP